MQFSFTHPYTLDADYSRPVAYYCMEYAIHQPLKLYAGGLGFLAGSYLRSAFEMRQNVVGVGILWKYGYYDQVRRGDHGMDILFHEKVYGFLQKTGVRFTINIAAHEVWVTALYLPPIIFNTAPLFLLSTDLPENDYLARTICHKLYDPNPEAKIAAAMLLGIGGAKLFEYLNWKPELYHLNESHALPLAFYLYNKYGSIAQVRESLVYTNHTPEEGGNSKTDLQLLERMGFFCNVAWQRIMLSDVYESNVFNHTLAALRLARIANGVSKMHLQTLKRIWGGKRDICPLISITNAQNFQYWGDHDMYTNAKNGYDTALYTRKLSCKQQLFELVADQNGEIFDKQILTIVFAKRFAGYKRADLLLRDMDRFNNLVNNKDRPVQIIWAGKPFPSDYTAISTFNRIVDICKCHANCTILAGYELKLSRLLKQGADVWLNVPRLTHEASGTSGMSAAMNGAINLSIPDGWFPEFAKDRVNSFVIPPADPALPEYEQDAADAASLYNLLEHEIIPMYYEESLQWMAILKNSVHDIMPYFDSNRMVAEYYRLLYNFDGVS